MDKTFLVHHILLLATAVQAIAFAGSADEATGASRPGAVPIGAQVPDLDDAASWEIANDLRVNLWHSLWAWSNLEPERGKYVWETGPQDKAQEFLKKLHEMDYMISIGDSTVHMDQKHMPSYFEDRRFNDPEVLDAWEAYLVAFLRQYGDYLDQFMIGNEVGSYFHNKPGEWEDYVAFFKRGAAVVRRERPNLPVGIILALGESEESRYWNDVKAHCQFLAVNYYTPCSTFSPDPTRNALDPEHPKYFGKAFERAFQWAAGKPIFIPEVGCATAPSLDSSPEIQAAFIDLLFQWLREHEGQVRGMSWLSLQDWPYEGTKQSLQGFLSPELLEHEGFMAYLTTLGLKYEDGRDKPGYAAFKQAIREYRGATPPK